MCILNIAYAMAWEPHLEKPSVPEAYDLGASNTPYIAELFDA